MTSTKITKWSRATLCTLGLVAMAAVGCQSTISGQTMPSAYYITDDVQYHPAGEEDRLPNLRRALDQYKLNQENDLDAGDQPPVPGP